MKLYHRDRPPYTPSLADLSSRGLVHRASTAPALSHRQREIVARLGSSEAVLSAFAPSMVLDYGQDYESRLQRPLPTLVELGRCYPQAPELMRAIMLNLVTGTVVALGLELQLKPEGMEAVARGLCANLKFRTLSMTSVLQFFYRLQTGDIDPGDWLTPARFLKLATAWARDAREAERRAAVSREHDLHARETEARSKLPTLRERWEKYKAEHGLDPYLTWAAWLSSEGARKPEK